MNRTSDKSKSDSPSHRNGLVAFLKSELGLSVTEYAVAAGLIAASLTATLGVLGTTIDALIATVIAFL